MMIMLNKTSNDDKNNNNNKKMIIIRICDMIYGDCKLYHGSFVSSNK
jgi:hypothetical protein